MSLTIPRSEGIAQGGSRSTVGPEITHILPMIPAIMDQEVVYSRGRAIVASEEDARPSSSVNNERRTGSSVHPRPSHRTLKITRPDAQRRNDLPNALQSDRMDEKGRGSVKGSTRSGSLVLKRFLKTSSALKSKMKPFTFPPKTNTDLSDRTADYPSSHKHTISSLSSSSPSPPSYRKSTTEGPRTSFSPRRSVSCRRLRRRSPDGPRRRNSHYQLAIRPRISGLFTPSLPPEIWAEILRFAGAAVEVDVDFSDVPTSTSPAPLAYSSSPSSSTGPLPTSFLTYQQQHHGHLSARLERYNSGLRFKAGLTRVCRLFHWLGQELLYEHVWIGKRKEGRMLAGRLCGDGGVGSAWGLNGDWGVSSVVSSGKAKVTAEVKAKKDGKKGGKKSFFGWFSRRRLVNDEVVPEATPAVVTVPKSRVRTTSSSSSSSVSPLNINVGHFIRRLHIETPSLDKCSPHDLLIILQYSTRLQEFFDNRSVQRPMHPLSLSASDVVPFSSYTSTPSPFSSAPSPSPSSSTQMDAVYHHHILTPDALLHTLFSRPLKRLSWTNYDHHPMDVVRGVKYYEDVIGPRLMLDGVGKGLEFLEISTSCSDVLFGNSGEGVWGVSQAGDGLGVGGGIAMRLSSLANSPSLGINSMLLTDLTASYTTTTTFSSLSASPSSASTSTSAIFPTSSPSIDGQVFTLTLPSLLSLKVTLDNATFTALSKWDMPRLTHLSVVSADFGYAAEGFRLFFEVHGWKISQLELGHSSEDIEEAWLTSRPSRTHLNGHGPADGPFSIPLDEWCPSLHTFICSADAEWNWQSPDWIAPHVLLPTHAGLEVIGVRDMERRLKGDANDAARRRRADVGRRRDDDEDEDPYFMLFEQFGSLLRKEAFPSLTHIRDMSCASDVIRRSGCIFLNSTSPSPSPAPLSQSLQPPSPLSPTTIVEPSSRTSGLNLLTKPRKLAQAAQMAKRDKELAREQGRRVIRFWTGVVEKCTERGVGLMNWRGDEVTLQSLGRPNDEC